MDCMFLDHCLKLLCESISNKDFDCSPNLVDFLPSLEYLASTFSFLQAFPIITSALWDENQTFLTVCLPVLLQIYGVYLGRVLILL